MTPVLNRIARELGLLPEVQAQLWAAYQTPGRHYHDLRHLEEVVTLLEDLVPDDILLAALFHDAVYVPTRSDNEERSADLMVHLVPDVSTRAVEAILATKTHVAEDPDVALLLDADLAVLGRPAVAYDQYAQEIRKEYCHVPEPEYRTGRAAVLQSFLKRDCIYRSEPFRRLEAAARANLAREISTLLLDAP